MKTDYLDRLQNTPEPLRSQLLYGDFGISQVDDLWQVIPTAWVRAAQARWNQEKAGHQTERARLRSLPRWCR